MMQWHQLREQFRRGNAASHPDCRATTVSVLWSAEPKTVHLHLPNLYVAQSLLLACPHLELIGEPYTGPWR